MAEREYPIKTAAVSVAATVGLLTILVYQWVLPTHTATLSYQNALLQEQLATANSDHATREQRSAERAGALSLELETKSNDVSAMSAEIEGLNARIFELERSNIFAAGIPYPVGLDKVRIGDEVKLVSERYADSEVKIGEYSTTVSDASPNFAWLFIVIRIRPRRRELSTV